MSESVTVRRAYVAAFLCILALGIGLRFYGLTIQSYWTDELHSALYARPDLTIGGLLSLATTDAHPPLFQIVLWVMYHVLGFSEFSGRVLSAVFGVLGLLAIWFLSRELWDRRAALFAIAIASPALFLVSYSQEVRDYSLLMFVTVVCWWALVKLVKSPVFSRSLVYALSAVLLIYTHYFGFFVLAGQVLFVTVLVTIRPTRYLSVFGWCAVAGTLTFLTFIPWLPVFQSNQMLSQTWIEVVGSDFPLEYVLAYFGVGFSVLRIAVVLVLLLALIQRSSTSDRKPSETVISYMIPVIWILTGWGLPYLVSVTIIPIMIPRVTIIVVPAIILLLSAPAAYIRTGFLVVISLATTIMLTWTLVDKDKYYRLDRKENWRAAVQLVMKMDPDGSEPVISNRWSGYFQAYFWLLGDCRTVAREPVIDSNYWQYHTAAQGFFFLDGHDMNGPSAFFSRKADRWFQPGEIWDFRKSRVTRYVFRSEESRAVLLGATTLTGTVRVMLQSVVSAGMQHLLPNDSIRIFSGSESRSGFFMVPAGRYRIRVQAAGISENGERPNLIISMENRDILSVSLPEIPVWFEQEWSMEEPRVEQLRVHLGRENRAKHSSTSTLLPGREIRIQKGPWDAVLTWNDTEHVYDAVFRNRVTGEELEDRIRVIEFTWQEVVFFRESVNGCYRGSMAPGRNQATGITDWPSGSKKWLMTFPYAVLDDESLPAVDVFCIAITRLE